MQLNVLFMYGKLACELLNFVCATHFLVYLRLLFLPDQLVVKFNLYNQSLDHKADSLENLYGSIINETNGPNICCYALFTLQ